MKNITTWSLVTVLGIALFWNRYTQMFWDKYKIIMSFPRLTCCVVTPTPTCFMAFADGRCWHSLLPRSGFKAGRFVRRGTLWTNHSVGSSGLLSCQTAYGVKVVSCYENVYPELFFNMKYITANLQDMEKLFVTKSFSLFCDCRFFSREWHCQTDCIEKQQESTYQVLSKYIHR